MATDFSEKNRRRKQYFDSRNREHRRARQRRRAMKGAFGRETNATWNDLIVGTSGVSRSSSTKDLEELITASTTN